MELGGIIYWKGDYVPAPEATVHVMSHSFGRGSAVFDVLGLMETGDGTCIFRLHDHVARLFHSAALLHMTLPLSPEGVSDAILETVRRNGFRNGFVKIMGFHGREALDVVPPEGPLDMAVAVVFGDKMAEAALSIMETATLCLSPWRKLDPRTVPVEAKAAAHYLNGMLARIEAMRRGFSHAVLLDTQENIAEGATESIFFVKNGSLIVPALGSVLDSITRRSIIEVARRDGLPVEEKRLSARILDEADEIFLASTVHRVLPVRQFEERRLPAAPGPMTLHLVSRIRQILAGKDGEFLKWLTPAG